MTDVPPETPGDASDRWLEGVRPTRRTVTIMLCALFGGGPALAQAALIRKDQIRSGGQTRVDFSKTIDSLDVSIADLVRTDYQIRRADDLLILDVKLINLSVTAAGAQMRRTDVSKDGVLVVTLPPQAIAETATDETAPAPTNPTESRISGPTRLAFTMPKGLTTAPWGIDGILEACRTWPQRLSPLARSEPDSVGSIVADGSFAIDVARTKLDTASLALIGGLSGQVQNRVRNALPGASERIGAGIAAQTRAGRDVTDAFVDGLIAKELETVTASVGRGLTARDAARLSGALEAAGAAAAIDILGPPPARSGKGEFIRAIDPGAAIVYAPGFALIANTPHAPSQTVTAVEVPYRLVQTPLPGAAWFHATAPVIRGGRTELWHTRLGRGGMKPRDLTTRPLRAIWSPDYPKAGPDRPSNQPIEPDQRRDLVRLTAGFDETRPGGGTFTPLPIQARRLILSALGATLDSHGAWKTRPTEKGAMPAVNVSAWTHKGALGRDHYVKIVEEGFLYPFGHAAAWVTVSERKFEQVGAGRLAVLRKREFLIVRELVREFPGSRHTHAGREFPFQRIELLTEITPSLKPLEGDFVVPRLSSGQDFKFRLVGVDRAGRRAPFTAPLVFLLAIKNNTDEGITAVRSAYVGGRNVVPFGDAEIALAPQATGDDPGDTVFKIETITFDTAAPKGGTAPGDVRFVPVLSEAKPRLDQVKTLLGQDRTPSVEFTPFYLENGFGGPNAKPQIFLNLKGAQSPLAQSDANPSDAFGGLMAPNLAPTALSRSFGAVAGENNAAKLLSGTFDIGDFMPSARLLGAVDLKDVLADLINTAISATGVEVPKLKTVQFPDRIEASYTFNHAPLGKVPPLFEPLPGSRISVDAKAVTHLPRPPALTVPPEPAVLPPQPEAGVVASLEHFQINLFSALVLTFQRIRFDARAGKKPRVDVDLHPVYGVGFGGPLEFVNALKDMIPTGGFAEPSPIAITPLGISASYNLALPSVQVGVCAIQDMSLGAAFDIAFTGGPPRARFNFAERQTPFNITVAMFGGGGFFAIAVDTGGMREIEAALEFGARAEINLGVASGGVYVKGGFYFRLKVEGTDQSIEFQGYIELGGHLSILKLISVSLTFHLSLNYALDKSAGTSRLFGQAVLSVKVEVLFFSKTVSIKVERQFAGSPADPLFIDFMPTQEVWRQYCEAFA
jgi:hypothetical protein